MIKRFTYKLHGQEDVSKRTFPDAFSKPADSSRTSDNIRRDKASEHDKTLQDKDSDTKLPSPIFPFPRDAFHRRFSHRRRNPILSTPFPESEKKKQVLKEVCKFSVFRVRSSRKVFCVKWS